MLPFEKALNLEGGSYKCRNVSTPFSNSINGEVDGGLQKGSIKRGKEEGSWEDFHPNGQLFYKGIGRAAEKTVLRLVTKGVTPLGVFASTPK